MTRFGKLRRACQFRGRPHKAWRDNLPSSLEGSPTAEALDAVLELRGHVEDLQAVELPKGFGRD